MIFSDALIVQITNLSSPKLLPPTSSAPPQPSRKAPNDGNQTGFLAPGTRCFALPFPEAPQLPWRCHFISLQPFWHDTSGFQSVCFHANFQFV